jgi:hypothetical protein
MRHLPSNGKTPIVKENKMARLTKDYRPNEDGPKGRPGKPVMIKPGLKPKPDPGAPKPYPMPTFGKPIRIKPIGNPEVQPVYRNQGFK